MALQEILRLHKLWCREQPGGARADFGFVDLSGADLKHATLSKADLCCANLNGANLSYAILGGAKLDDANLQDADMTGVALQHTSLYGVNMTGTCLDGALMKGVSVERAKGIVCFGPIGKRGVVGYAVKHKEGAMVHIDGSWGTEDQAIAWEPNHSGLIKAACEEVMKHD